VWQAITPRANVEDVMFSLVEAMLQSRSATRFIAVCLCWASGYMRLVSGVHAGCLGYHHGTWKSSSSACYLRCRFQSALHGKALLSGSALCLRFGWLHGLFPSPEPTGASSDLLGCGRMIPQSAMLPQRCCLSCRAWSSTSGGWGVLEAGLVYALALVRCCRSLRYVKGDRTGRELRRGRGVHNLSNVLLSWKVLCALGRGCYRWHSLSVLRTLVES
jgi:hypothetical protein